MKKIIGKKFLYNILLISKADNKIIEAIVRIYLHNMP